MLINPGWEKYGVRPAISNTETNTFKYKDGIKLLNIGERYEGGIIFYIDASGQHGLIASLSDQGFTRWGSALYIPTGARGTAVGTGLANTNQITSVLGRESIYAALLCANYNYDGYSGWYLPSKDELYLLYLKKNVVGGFTKSYYWSSTEFDRSLAWTKFFYNNDMVCSYKDRLDGVRAIRSF